MRRWLALFLLCLFSLQSVWAAAATYCQHESAPAAAHFGHHAHEHAHAQADDADGTPDDRLAVDLDCHACHAGIAGLWPQALPPLPAVASLSTLAPPLAQLAIRPPEAIDRPDWRCPA